jgi:mono/diheme cytochrome c family protein/glucose/arabinose dehydrogenase
MKRFALPALLVLLAPLLSRAQLGDLVEDGAEPTPPAARNFRPSPPLSAREELATFQMPPGFRMELVADESLVHEPVAAAFDRDGSLWICQDQHYNAPMLSRIPGLAAGAASMPPGQIVKLESSRHDGHFDRRVVWLDGLNEPRGIMLVHGGVIIADPPYLWLARDVHGTGKCDDKTLLDGSYGVPFSEEESGSLLWGRDNLLRNISAANDYRWRHGAIVGRVPVPVRGQFGITQDDFGRLFYSLNSDLLRGDVYAPEYASRNSGVPAAPWVDVQISRDQEVWPSHPTPAVNRGYRPGKLGASTGGMRDDGTLLEVTAACSPLVYRGANFPAQYYGNVLVPDPSANLVTRNLLVETQGRVSAIHAYQGREFLASTDTRFRPVALLNSPDGSLLILDMYRGILEGYGFITTYMHQQIVRRELTQPAFGLGRIWKLTYTGGPLPAFDGARLNQPTAQLPALLADPNGWWRDSVQQELVERGDAAAAPALTQIAAHGARTDTRVAALWTLDGLGAASLEVLGRELHDPEPKVRAAAVRMHERWLQNESAGAAVEQLGSVARDPAPEVCVQLALTLGQATAPAALDLMARLVLSTDDHPFLPKAIATGLAGREMAFIDRLAPELAPDRPRPDVEALLELLAASVAHGGDRGAIGQLIAAAADSSPLPQWARLALVTSIDSILAPTAPRFFVLPGRLQPAMFTALTASTDSAIRQGGVRITAALQKAEEETRRQMAEARPLNADEQKQYEQGKMLFQICAACHQPTGLGLPHVAPSLVESPWVPGNPEVLTRIVLGGKEGTPGFASSMPPVGGTFTDEQIAAVLTYIRNSWGLHAGAVPVSRVAKARQQIAGRPGAWTDVQLARVRDQLARGRNIYP